MKRGFTLVELSIVLVIIGLLIGGILVAQSMINTTRIQSVIRQVGQFDAAVSNFTTKYRGLPGDNPLVMTSATSMDGSASGKANNDGSLNSFDAYFDYFSGEIGSFWNALSLSGLSTNGNGINGTIYNQASSTTATSLITQGANANVPKSPLGKNAAFVAFSSNPQTSWYGLISTDQYTSSAFINSDSTNSALRPVDALALDKKMDDGSPQSGVVMSMIIYASNGTNYTGLFTDGSAPPYDTTITTNAQDIAIRIGGMSGELR